MKPSFAKQRKNHVLIYTIFLYFANEQAKQRHVAMLMENSVQFLFANATFISHRI